MFVCYDCCMFSGRDLRGLLSRAGPTECGVSECVRETSTVRRS